MATKKGFHILVKVLPELLERCPEAHCVLAGGGDLLNDLKAACASVSERVHFPGMVYRDTLPDLYRSADVFTLPAVHDSAGNVDGLPNVILEAMASGLPVVASEISGIPLAVREGQEGHLVPEAEPQPLLEALTHLLSSREDRQRMGTSARQRAELELTWDAIAARYREGYVSAV
jgi:glycosyltransferase involved in cell wall biosynthesis